MVNTPIALTGSDPYMKKVLFLLLFPLIAETVISCCNCIETVTQHYTNKTLSVQHLDNRGQEPQVGITDSLAKDAYGIRLSLIREKLACRERKLSLFLPPAYAMGCHCPPPKEFLPKDSIVAVRVFTQTDFDATTPAGTAITSYFSVYSDYRFTPVDQYFSLLYPVLFDEKELALTVDLLLMTPPPAGRQHRFLVQMTLSDGRLLEAETTPLKLI